MARGRFADPGPDRDARRRAGRVGVPFFFPEQLAAFLQQSGRMRWAYALFLAGNIALFPGVIHLAQQICRRRPYGVQRAASLVRDVYTTTEWVVAPLNGAILIGWIVLAVGAFLAKVMPVSRCLGLLAMAALMIGILKGTRMGL
ncbi:MAG: hypothetical protein GEV07_21530 [Streptosporangiales bacterium]|nr:hypothetical protein [Streptosporangiales bacterium]